MITLLTGENNFELERALQALVARFDGDVERFDGSELTIKQLPDLLMGGTLFATSRLVVIKGLADNKQLWPVLGDWLPRISDEIHLVLIEPKPDKRTKTFKDLQKVADVQTYAAWTERDVVKAEQWVSDEATRQGVVLDRSLARLLVERVGLEQWQLYHALQKLSTFTEVTETVIREHIDAQPSENVFNLFEAALRGDTLAVSQMIRTLELTEDPYRLFGLLSGQAFQFAALAVTDKPNADVAKDIGAHPYALSKLATRATRAGRGGAQQVIAAFLEADTHIKTSSGEPWLLIERALIKVSRALSS
jgi:DNA polymerase III delta subunit